MICCMIYTTGSLKNAMNQFVAKIIQRGYQDVVISNSNIVGYLQEKNESLDANMLVKAINDFSPIHTYIVYADELKFQEVSERQSKDMANMNGETITYNEMEQFLFTNGEVKENIVCEVVDGNDDTGEETKADTMIQGEIYMEDETTQVFANTAPAVTDKKEFYTLEQLKDFDFFISKCYIVDPTTVASSKVFDAKTFAQKDMTIDTKEDEPKILIYHTHSQESFYDSRKGNSSDTIVGVGDVLTQILEEKYNISVIHDRNTYDMIDGKLDRSLAYSVALPSIKKTLEKYPSIEVVIDLHRDGMPAGLSRDRGKRAVNINGEECAQIMLFNGVSRNKNGPIKSLPNPNLTGNLAFSFQIFKEGRTLYPNLMKPIYLKSYRFNLHLKERSLLIELGTQYNTVAEEKNSMKYLAQILTNVLEGK